MHSYITALGLNTDSFFLVHLICSLKNMLTDISPCRSTIGYARRDGGARGKLYCCKKKRKKRKKAY